MRTTIRLLLVGALIAIGVAGAVLRPGGATSQIVGNEVLDHAAQVEEGLVAPDSFGAQVSGGAVNTALQATGFFERRAAHGHGAGGPGFSSAGTQGCQNTFTGGGPGGNNVRINQDCSLRRQAEEVVVPNPNNAKNLIAGQNDSRLGFNKCGYDWSFDGGKTWGDQVPPFYQFIGGDGHTFDACSDPTATFDSQGNAYIGGVLFDISSAASAFVVAKSNNPIGGAFYHTPAALSFQEYRDVPLGVVANDNDPNVFNDKEFIVADSNSSSPKADNVYATWTRFNGATGAGVGGNSPIYFSQSTNGGATWSAGIEISGANAANCTVFSGESNPNACDQDQGSHPIVGSDGTLYVAFGNGNTPLPGINQHMIVKCPASSNCALPASWTAPVKTSDDIGTQPVGPNATTACPAGRQCLPPNGYRLDDFVEGSISVDNSGNLYSVWADFRNGGGTCTGPAATATPPCDNDVFMSVSTDGGATWGPAINVTPAAKFGPSAQWMPWSAVAPNGKKLFIGYYDRSYGTCETTGCNDITMATVDKPASAARTFKYTRITTSSMPNLVVANNPLQAGFLGDYMWVSTDTKGNPYLTWADTRGLGGTVEEDIYLATP
jgi:hypothetical protein